MAKKPLKMFKVNNISEVRDVDALYCIKTPTDTEFTIVVTDAFGAIVNLKDLQTPAGIQGIASDDGTIEVTGATFKNLRLSATLVNAINSALKAGDNISDLVNDAGYLTSFTETDPIFQASEASNFVSGDKANLDNQSGINTGDETTSSIQTKRPLKTVDGKSLEGTGNIEIDYNTVINKPTEFPPSTHTHIISEVVNLQNELNSKENISNKVNTISGNSSTEYPTEKAVVDYVSSQIGADFAKVVYFDNVTPNVASIFDLNNPPLVNDPSLKEDVANLYIGTDASTWVYITSPAGYVTKTVTSSGSNFYITGTNTDAGSIKTGSITKKGQIVIDSEVVNDSGLTLKKTESSILKTDSLGKVVKATNLQDVEYAPIVHTHTVSQITDFPTFKTIEGQSVIGAGNIDLNKSDVGLGNVDNTSDLNKPISTATQTALNLKENVSNKQNSLAVDGTGTKYPTVDAVNAGLATKTDGFLNIPDGTNIINFTIDGINARVTTSANYSKSGDPKKLAIFFHYYGGNYTTMPSAVLKDSLLNNGYSIATLSAGDTWGNEKAQQKYASLYNYVLKKFNVETQPIAVSASMGTITALNVINRNLIPFRSLVSVVGVVNLSEYYSRAIGLGAGNSIQAAYNFVNPSDSEKAFFGFDPYTKLKNNFGDLTYPISCPVYFVNGELDTSTPLIFTNDIYAALSRNYSNSILDVTAGGIHDVEMVTPTIAGKVISWLGDNEPLSTRVLPEQYPLLEVNNGIRMRDKLLGSTQLNYINFEKQDGTSRGLFGYLLPDVIGADGMSWVNKQAGIGIYGSDASSVFIGVVNSLGFTTNLIEANVLGGKHLYFYGQSDTFVDTNVKIQMKSGGASVGVLKWIDVSNNAQNAFLDAFDYRFRMSGVDKITFSNSGTITASPAVSPNQVPTLGQVQAIAGRPYKVYTALLSQTGTNAPTATVLENTLGGNPTLNYIGVGNYAVDLTGAFTSEKTGVIISNGIPLILSASSLNNDRVIINCGAGNNRITNATIEIRVYN